MTIRAYAVVCKDGKVHAPGQGRRLDTYALERDARETRSWYDVRNTYDHATLTCGPHTVEPLSLSRADLHTARRSRKG